MGPALRLVENFVGCKLNTEHRNCFEEETLQFLVVWKIHENTMLDLKAMRI